jgi:hypothetical protein
MDEDRTRKKEDTYKDRIQKKTRSMNDSQGDSHRPLNQSIRQIAEIVVGRRRHYRD